MKKQEIGQMEPQRWRTFFHSRLLLVKKSIEYWKYINIKNWNKININCLKKHKKIILPDKSC